MHIVAIREGGYLCEKNGDYDDTRRDRCDRQGVRGAAHQPAGGELAAGDGEVTAGDGE